MNREILFRGKRRDNGEWVYGYLVKSKTDWGKNIATIFTDIFTAEVIPETVGEYTGLTDKNGKKVFEGDLIKPVVTDIQKESIAEVCIGEFADINADDDLYFGVYLKCEGNIFSAGQLKQYNIKFEVIGTVYDNPELLGAENDR